MIRDVTSRTNPSLKLAASLLSTSGCRKAGKYIIEGPRFIADLVGTAEIDFAVLSETASDNSSSTAGLLSETGVAVLRVPEKLFTTIASTGHSQGLAAVRSIPTFPADMVFDGRTVLILDGVGDPGNAGTAVRSAAAFDCGGVVFLRGSAYPWSPKVSRSSAGLNSVIPVIMAESLEELASSFPDYLFLEAAADGDDIGTHEIESPVALVIGSEAAGVKAGTKRFTGGKVSIPMVPGVESLNAGVSASILLYCLFRMKP